MAACLFLRECGERMIERFYLSIAAGRLNLSPQTIPAF